MYHLLLRTASSVFSLVALSFLAVAVHAQPGRGSVGSWERSSSLGHRPLASRRDSSRREGKVEVKRFVTQDRTAEALGQGPIMVVMLVDGGQSEHDSRQFESTPPQDKGLATYGPSVHMQTAWGSALDDRYGGVYEAAVITQLVNAGYETRLAPGTVAQHAELRISHRVVEPEEAPHKPLSGTMEMGVSNRGTMMGMGLYIDLTKPRKALFSTRLEARIRDAKTGAVLWEGRADIATRDGDEGWSHQAIAARLSEALFNDFPGKPEKTSAVQ